MPTCQGLMMEEHLLDMEGGFGDRPQGNVWVTKRLDMVRILNLLAGSGV